MHCFFIHNRKHAVRICPRLQEGDIPDHAAIADCQDDDEHCDAPDAHSHAAMEAENDMNSDKEQLCEDMSKWMFVRDSDSEDDDEEANVKGSTHATRERVVESRPEYIRLKEAGLHLRPGGCTLGIHPSACTWRSSAATSAHFGRSFNATSGRTSYQALLIVMELMLNSHVKSNPDDALARKQLSRVRKARKLEPPHKD